MEEDFFLTNNVIVSHDVNYEMCTEISAHEAVI